MGIHPESFNEREHCWTIMKALLLLLVFSRSSHGRPQIGSTEPEQQSLVSLQSGQQQFMNRLLQQIESNLTGISDEALSASEAVHQAFIEVNEEGTEAAAATAAVVGLRTAQQRKGEFFADRPFLFVVYDFEHGVTLFAG